MTRRLMDVADDLCGGRLVMAHEGGYSEVHVPFCGHGVISTLAGSAITAPDPLDDRITAHQPSDRVSAVQCQWIDELLP